MSRSIHWLFVCLFFLYSGSIFRLKFEYLPSGSRCSSVDPHTLMSLGGHVTIFSNKMTLKLAAKHIIQFSDHVRFKDMGYQCTWLITSLLQGRGEGPGCVDVSIWQSPDKCIVTFLKSSLRTRHEFKPISFIPSLKNKIQDDSQNVFSSF